MPSTFFITRKILGCACRVVDKFLLLSISSFNVWIRVIHTENYKTEKVSLTTYFNNFLIMYK